jgi:hypothetical protein
VTPRRVRILVDLGWLAGIVALLFWARETAEALRRPPPRPPEGLPFKTIAERFGRVEHMMPDEQVFALLGPQRFAKFWEPEMGEYDGLVKLHPYRYPGEHYWAKWADPADPSRWVAVFFSGGRVFRMLKRGV